MLLFDSVATFLHSHPTLTPIQIRLKTTHTQKEVGVVLNKIMMYNYL